MSVNKLALIRYKTIDDCLRNKLRRWTLEDLIEKVSDVLYNLEGISTGISRRTLQSDLQLMRSDKLGYNAPIIVLERKYYTYSDKDFSITKAPINEADVEKMKEVVGMLKQFSGFSYFEDMSELIARLENNLYRSTQRSPDGIQFEDNKLLKGREFITPLYQAILRRQSLLLEYQSFRAARPQHFICYPYLLKEYRNRWFLIMKVKGKAILFTVALDRIIGFQELPKEKYIPYAGVDFERYYSDLLGVTKNETDRGHRVILFVSKEHAPYVLTKPLHHSQQVLKEDPAGMIIRIDVVLNFELEREILGFGEAIKVLAPRLLKSKIQKRLKKTVAQYDVETKITGL